MNRIFLFLLVFTPSTILSNRIYPQNQLKQEVCVNDPGAMLILAEAINQKPDQVIQLSTQALTLLSADDRQDLMAKAYQLIGRSYYEKNQFNLAIENLLRSIGIYKQISNSIEIAKSLNIIGVCYMRKDLYTLALDYLQQALTIYEKIENKKLYGGTLNNIGIIYRKIGQLDKSLEFYKKCHQLFKEIDDKSGFSSVENNIGLIYMQLEQYQEALSWFTKAIETRLELKDTLNIANTYNNLGEVHEKINNYSKALKYYEETVRLSEIVGNRHGLALGYANLAHIQFLTLNYDKVRGYLDKSQHIAEEDEEYSIIRQNYSLYFDLYYAMADYHALKGAMDKYRSLTDNMFGEQVSKELAALSVKFESDHKEQENRILQANLELEKLKVSRSRDVLYYYSAISIVIASLLLYTLYFIRRLRIKNSQIEQFNRQLNKLNFDLEEKVVERTRELSEALKKAEESEKLKSAFLTNMSHEVRTPMNVIIGFARILENDDVIPEDRKRYLELINHQGRSLLQIINDIINLSKIETGQLEIKTSICNANKILDGLYTMFKDSNYLNKKNEIELVVNKPIADSSCNFVSDSVRVEQVLINLLDNAHKFTEKGTVEFGYSIVKGNTIQFYVKDTGTGIPEDKLEMIFNRFYKHYQNDHTLFGGAGLGLSISKKLANLLGGDLIVESEINKGSRFTLTIPFISADTHVDNTVSKSLMNKSSYVWPNKVVLVVEDDSFSYQYIEALLQGTKMKIIHAKNGEDAVSICQSEEKLDVVLMDIQLPFMSGYEATKKIKAIRKKIPVIAQTANVLNDERVLTLEAGCDYYISKPIDPDELYLAISRCLNGND